MLYSTDMTGVPFLGSARGDPNTDVNRLDKSPVIIHFKVVHLFSRKKSRAQPKIVFWFASDCHMVMHLPASQSSKLLSLLTVTVKAMTYDLILQHFFWPSLKRNIALFIKTCHTCQLTGKPNRVVKPAPLQPFPAIG